MAYETTQPKLRAVWRFDSAHSSMEFAGKHMSISTVKGRFNDVVGVIIGDLENPADALIEVDISADSIDTGSRQRDAHLRSGDFLDSRRYPVIEFRSTKIEPLGEDTFWVRGKLIVRGIPHEVNLVGSVDGQGVNREGDEIIAISAETAVKLRDMGIDWNLQVPGGKWLIGDDIRLDLHIEAVREL
jgi:polyisoprenoid-binding protein YceI